MTETEKKELAEWLKSSEIVMMNGNFFKYQPNKPPWGKVPWNPDTNPEQFLEVLEHMTDDEKYHLEFDIAGKFKDAQYLEAFDTVIWIMSHKSEVIKALLQIINQ